MAITQNSDRQYVLQGEVVITFDDYTEAAGTTTPGEANEAVAIPANSRVVGGQIITTVAYDELVPSATYTMTVGDGVDRARYLAAAAVDAATAAGQHPLVPTGFVYTADDDVSVNLIGSDTSPIATGASILQVQYTIAGRSNVNLD